MQGPWGHERRDMRWPDATADGELGALPRLPHQLYAKPIMLGVHHCDTQLSAQPCPSPTLQRLPTAAEVGVHPTPGLNTVPAVACQEGRFVVCKSSVKLHFSPPPSQARELQKGRHSPSLFSYQVGFLLSM